MKILLLIAGVWITSFSLAFAAGEPFSLASFSKTVATLQDAPVYPNPARDHIFFRLDDVEMTAEGDLSIEVRDILGNKMPVRLDQTASDTYRISLTNYPSGYYMLILRCERCSATQGSHKEIHKFLKQ